GDTTIMNWLNTANSLDIKRVATFLKSGASGDTNCNNQEALNFAVAAIEALENGGEVDWEDKIIILVDKPCAAVVIKDANSLDNEIGQRMREAFDNDETDYNVNITNGNVPQTDPNKTKIAETYPILNEDGSIKSRSEERRVGKECRYRWSTYNENRRTVLKENLR